MKKAYSIGNGWLRVKTRAGLRFFHKGKIVSAAKFTSAAKRIRVARKDRAEKETAKLRRSLKLKPLKKKSNEKLAKRDKRKSTTRKQTPKGSRSNPIALCRVADRQAFYEQIKSDRKAMRDSGKIDEEEISDMRVVVDIGYRHKKKVKKTGKQSQKGYRSFRSLPKLKNFLGLNYKYRGGDLHEQVDWTKRGVCQFEKRAYQSVVKLRGERVISERILKRYAIEQPF